MHLCEGGCGKTLIAASKAWKHLSVYALSYLIIIPMFKNKFLARLYESTGRAIAVTPASALASALLKMLKFLVKVFIRLYLLNMFMD